MATIKSYTDLQQSKKLAKILPIETADMWWSRCTITDFGDGVLKVSYAVEPCNISQFRNTREDVPCWSLSALLGVLPKIGAEEPMVMKLYYANEPKERYICEYSLTNMTSEYDNPVDSCVAMVEKLHKLNLLRL